MSNSNQEEIYIGQSVVDENVEISIASEPEAEHKMVLRTENLIKKYGQRTVVNHVSIDVTQGDVLGARCCLHGGCSRSRQSASPPRGSRAESEGGGGAPGGLLGRAWGLEPGWAV